MLYKPLRITASTLIKSRSGELFGVFVSASTAGTLKFSDSADGATIPIIDTFTGIAGTFYRFGPIGFSTAIYCTVTGTIVATIAYK